MKFYESSFSYDYSFSTVTLAYFLRYPNPYSKHVISTDVIDRYVDPDTGRLHTTRLVLKKSKVPSAMLRLIPKGLAGPGGASQSYVIERSTVDVREGWMKTESKNMEWTGILSVIESQTYKRQSQSTLPRFSHPEAPDRDEVEQPRDWTSCKTIVTFKSRFGQQNLLRRREGSADEAEATRGFFSSWSTGSVQRTIELIGVRRTKDAVVNGKQGMSLVLERLRNGGVVGVLEGMRQDREEGRMGV